MWEGLGLKLHVEKLAFKRWRNIYFFISGGQEEKTGTDAGY